MLFYLVWVIVRDVSADRNAFIRLYVPVTVHREQSVKKEYQQDAKI